jgi:hypothetical protein
MAFKQVVHLLWLYIYIYTQGKHFKKINKILCLYSDTHKIN